MRTIRHALFLACLALAAGCGSDDSPAPMHTLTPGAAYHGAMTPAAALEVGGDAGPQAITAVADPGFVFAGWIATPADKAAFEDAALAATHVVLSGNATIAPTFMVASADYFVNPRLGSDTAAGTTAAQPFKTLTHALAVAGAPVLADDARKGAGPVVALAPGLYDAANGETFPIIVPTGVAVIGDEDNHGSGIVVAGAGPLPGRADMQSALIPSPYAAVAGIHVAASGVHSMAYDETIGGAGITLRNNTIESGGMSGLYIQVASGGVIVNNIWSGGTKWTLLAVGGNGDTRVQENIFQGPVELDNNYVDLGGGTGASIGHNQIIGDAMCYFAGAGIKARNNHWRHAPPTVAPSWSPGVSDYDMYKQGVNTTVDTEGYY